MRSGLVSAALVGALACGCGGDDGGVVDGPDARGFDATIADAPADDCYRERDDAGNAVTAEATGLTRGVGTVVLCGTISADHPSDGVLDVDRYQIAVATAGPAALRVSAPGAGAIERVEVVIESAGGVISRSRVIGGVGVAVVNLPVGAHTVTLTAIGAATAPVAYRMTLLDDQPSIRCPLQAAAPDYRERDESAAGHRVNDTVAVDVEPLVTRPTPITSDAPEPTQLAVTAGSRATLVGSSADVGSDGDDYHDRDTYALYTGQATNLLEIRATWMGAADLDVLVFEADKVTDPLGLPVSTVTGELAVTAVKPSTRYWIWIGGAARSTSLPVAYTLSVCGTELPVAP